MNLTTLIKCVAVLRNLIVPESLIVHSVTDVSSCVIESAYIMYTLNIPVAETGITAKRKNLVLQF